MSLGCKYEPGEECPCCRSTDGCVGCFCDTCDWVPEMDDDNEEDDVPEKAP